MKSLIGLVALALATLGLTGCTIFDRNGCQTIESIEIETDRREIEVPDAAGFKIGDTIKFDGSRWVKC